MEKNNTWNVRRLVDKSFVPLALQSSVLYCRWTDFKTRRWLTVISDNFIPPCIHDLDNIFLNWFFCHAHDINCPHKTLTFSILGRSRKSISILHTYFRCNTFLMLHTPPLCMPMRATIYYTYYLESVWLLSFYFCGAKISKREK